MKLYATIQSERALKGQGGNEYLEILIRNEERRPFLAVLVQATTPQNARVVITDYDNERILLDGNYNLQLPAIQLDAPKLRKHLIHDPRTCENSVPCFDCEQQYEFGAPRQQKRKCSICGDPLYGEVQVHHHNEDCKKCGYTMIASQQHNCKTKGKKEKSKKCGNCERPATQSIANLNRCDRCTTL